MEILASLGGAANGCAVDAAPTQGQKAAARVVENSQGGRGNRRGPGLGQPSSRRGVDEGKPLRAECPARCRGKAN